MSYEVTIVCDGCSALIASGRGATRVRQEVRASGGRARDGKRCRVGLPGGVDLCWDCAESGDSR